MARLIFPHRHCLVLIALTLAPISRASAQLEVGAAAINITPSFCDDASANAAQRQYDEAQRCFRWIHLAGFSPFVPFRDDARLATGIHDPLWARTLVLRDGQGDTVIIVATDLPGLGRKHTGPIRRRISSIHGVPEAHIILHSTHTHSAPDASGYWSTLMAGHNYIYTELLRVWILQSVEDALAGLRPATMKTVTTTHLSCIDGHTGKLKTAPFCRLPDINNQFELASEVYDQFLTQRDQRDPIVRNTRIVAAEFTAVDTGDTISTLINWHNHPDTLGSGNRLLSSDYPHYLRKYVEQRQGGIAVYVVGTLGNQIGGLRSTPVPLWDESGAPVFEQLPDGSSTRALVTDGWDKIRSTGYEIAAAAIDALEGVKPVRVNDVAVRTHTTETPVNNMIHVLGTWSVWHDGVEPEERLRYSWPDCLGLLGCVRTEVSLVTVGELSIITAPGEIDPAYVLGRKTSSADYGPWGTWHFPAMPGVDRLMPGKHHAVIGSAHDYLSYMIPTSDNVGWWNFNHPNHYEDWVTVGAAFGDNIARAWQELLTTTDGATTRDSAKE